MKRIVLIILSVVTVLSAFSCTRSEKVESEGTTTPEVITSPTETTTIPVQTDDPAIVEKRNRLGFGFMRMPTVANGLFADIDVESAKGHVNTYMVGLDSSTFEETASTLEKIKESDGLAWMCISWTILYENGFELKDGWDVELKKLMDAYRERGLTDVMAGFYFDEPLLCGIPKEVFRDTTKRLREMYPTMRTFACFAINCIAPYIWSTGNDQELDYDTAQYLTDAAFDMYWEVNDQTKSTYNMVTNALKSHIGRDDVRIWYVPMVMNGRGVTSEKACIDHLNFMYELLMRERNPGGLFCYAYDISNGDGVGNVGFKDMRDREDGPWTVLEERLVEIGRELIQDKSE